jgi:hypothetical protein
MKKCVLCLAAALALGLAGCVNIGNWQTIRGSGKVITENRSVSQFCNVSLGGSGELVITQGAEESLTIETDDNLLPHIKTEVSGDHLWIGWKNGNLRPSKRIYYRLQVKNLDSVNLSGSLSARAGDLKTSHLELEISGSGNIKIGHLEARKVVTHISGSGDVALAGTVGEESIHISGSGNQQAGDLRCQTATVAISGSGQARLWVEDHLSAQISGSGSVDYYGKPRVDMHTSGSGRGHSLGDK